MEALIRFARLAPNRTRLSDSRVGQAALSGTAIGLRRDQPPLTHSKQDPLEDRIEKQVASEVAMRLRKVCDEERSHAREQGFAEGLAEAKAAVAKELANAHEALRTRFDSALDAMALAHKATLSKLEASVGEVAFAAVCRVASRQAVSQAFVLGIVEHTCAQLRADLVATVRLHPRDVDTLRELMQEQELRVRSVGMKVVPDESLKLGGCVIEAASGQYDGGLENQLRRLHAALVGDLVVGGTPTVIHAAECRRS
jgi:flagellar assembly protein FliH